MGFMSSGQYTPPSDFTLFFWIFVLVILPAAVFIYLFQKVRFTVNVGNALKAIRDNKQILGLVLFLLLIESINQFFPLIKAPTADFSTVFQYSNYWICLTLGLFAICCMAFAYKMKKASGSFADLSVSILLLNLIGPMGPVSRLVWLIPLIDQISPGSGWNTYSLYLLGLVPFGPQLAGSFLLATIVYFAVKQPVRPSMNWEKVE